MPQIHPYCFALRYIWYHSTTESYFLLHARRLVDCFKSKYVLLLNTVTLALCASEFHTVHYCSDVVQRSSHRDDLSNQRSNQNYVFLQVLASNCSVRCNFLALVKRNISTLLNNNRDLLSPRLFC